MKKNNVLILLLALTFFLLPFYVSANMKDTKGNIKVFLNSDKELEFKLYKVASLLDENLIKENEFDYEDINLEKIDYANDIRNLVKKLDIKIKNNDIKPLLIKQSTNNEINFNNLDYGIYLITYEDTSKEDITYVMDSILITIKDENEIKVYPKLMKVENKENKLLINIIKNYLLNHLFNQTPQKDVFLFIQDDPINILIYKFDIWYNFYI